MKYSNVRSKLSWERKQYEKLTWQFLVNKKCYQIYSIPAEVLNSPNLSEKVPWELNSVEG
jgi:hypothetical protein